MSIGKIDASTKEIVEDKIRKALTQVGASQTKDANDKIHNTSANKVSVDQQPEREVE